MSFESYRGCYAMSAGGFESLNPVAKNGPAKILGGRLKFPLSIMNFSTENFKPSFWRR